MVFRYTCCTIWFQFNVVMIVTLALTQTSDETNMFSGRFKALRKSSEGKD